MVSGVDLQPYLSVTSVPLYALVHPTDTSKSGDTSVGVSTTPNSTVVKATLLQVCVCVYVACANSWLRSLSYKDEYAHIYRMENPQQLFTD